jgi:hypothetical protein
MYELEGLCELYGTTQILSMLLIHSTEKLKWIRTSNAVERNK